MKQNNLPLATGDFTPQEQLQLTQRLLPLLRQQARKAGGCDSTSMPLERAQELLESLLYTLQAAVEDTSCRRLLTEDLTQLLAQGRERLTRRKRLAKVQWQLLRQDLPAIPNKYFLGTVRGLEQFFKKYDVYEGAHLAPGIMAYPLLRPMSGEWRGVSYVEEYLRRLQLENDALNCFDRERVIALYRQRYPNYTEALFNLCEPVLKNALSLSLLGEDIHRVTVTQRERERLTELLACRSRESRRDILAEAMERMCRELGLSAQEEREYFALLFDERPAADK